MRWLLLLLLLISPRVMGKDSVTLPLEGYFHPGRYMPVHVIASPPQGKPNAVVVRGDDMVWSAVSSRDGEDIDAYAPMMPIGTTVRSVSWIWLGQPGHELPQKLQPLNDHQKLIGIAQGPVNSAEAMRLAQTLYPGNQLIAEPLNPAQPLPGIPACWEALDLIALDAATAARIDEQRLSALVAAGTIFAVRADHPPYHHWPWKPAAGGWWILRFTPAGPADANPDPRVYSPVAHFMPGWAASARWRFVMDAVVVSLLLLLLSLWRPRFMPVWGFLIALIATGALVYFHQWERPLRLAEGKIRIIGKDLTQDDDWAYYTTPQGLFSRNRWVDSMHLVVPSAQVLDEMQARVECFSNGDADALCFVVPDHAKAAVYCRRCGPQPPAIPPAPDYRSPLEPLAREVYLKPGGQILGEVKSSPLISEGYFHLEQWPSVAIKQ